ncbi:MAG: formate dehydrogenase subunit gamma [Anaerolineae bacterium]
MYLEEKREYMRFDRHQRAQHLLLVASFVLCALTGLPQKYHDLPIAQQLINGMGGIEAVRSIHHISAWTMGLTCVYHLIYVAWNVVALRKPFPLKVFPNLQDFKDLLGMFKYFLGLAKEKPQFDRFTYFEKFDYWAVFWGIAIIGGSGLMLMFPVTITRFLPGIAVPVAKVLHGDEAVLAVGWLAIVHLFYTHLNPRVFPFNPAMFTGRISIEEMKENHPLEYERLMAELAKAEPWRVSSSQEPG